MRSKLVSRNREGLAPDQEHPKWPRVVEISSIRIGRQVNTNTTPKSAKVFVIDDDPAVLNSLKFSLGVDGYDVAGYADARSFLAAIEQVPGGCVVVDYGLPDVNGLAVAAQLRSQGIIAPIILIASNPTTAVRREASLNGIRLIEKPLIPGFLNAAIRSALRLRPPAI